ncbi:chaperone Ric-8B-like isoform X2 [Convolutriloba macropyga]
MDADFKSALSIITASADQSYEQTRLSLDEFFIKYKICTNLSGVQMETLTSLVDSIGNFLEDKLKSGEDAEQIDEVLEVVIRTLLVLTRDRRSQRSILECCLQSLLLCAKITIIPSTFTDDSETTSAIQSTLSTKTRLAAVKCLCNLVFQSQSTGSDAVSLLKNLNFELDFASYFVNHYQSIESWEGIDVELLNFEFTLLFIYTAIVSESRSVFMAQTGMIGVLKSITTLLVNTMESNAKEEKSSHSENESINGKVWKSDVISANLVLGNVLKTVYTLVVHLDDGLDSDDASSNHSEIQTFLVELTSTCEQVLRKTSSETGTTNGANGQSVLNPKCLSDEELLTHTYSVLGVMPAYALQKVFAVSNETDEENAGNEGACSNYIPEEGTEENPVVKTNESEETNGQINVNKVDSASEWAVNVLYSAIRVAVHSSDSVTFKMALFLALSTICRSCREIRKKLRQKILPPRRDVHVMPQEGQELKNELVRMMTGVNRELGELVSELLFVLCKENVNRLLKYTGYGNAAGMMFTRGLGLKSAPPSGSCYSDDEDTDTEEFKEHEHGFNYVTGRYEEPKPDPMAGESEERKLYETEQLLNTLTRMQGTAFQPMTMGPDGTPVPLMDQIARQAHESTANG